MQPGIKSSIFYCPTGLILMNAIETHKIVLRMNLHLLSESVSELLEYRRKSKTIHSAKGFKIK